MKGKGEKMCEICPACGGIAEFNAYYGRITCTRCAWEGKQMGLKQIKIRGANYLKQVTLEKAGNDPQILKRTTCY